jgi:hypothetical protein
MGVDRMGKENERDENGERKMCGGNGVRTNEESRTNEKMKRKGDGKNKQLMKSQEKIR